MINNKMKEILRIYTISATNLLASACFTIISSFYSSTALKSGVPEALIGVIFSTFPLFSIMTSFFVPFLMEKFSRSAILITGLVLISFSSMLISALESFEAPLSIVVSFASRAISGTGAAFEVIAANSILTSDYPENVQKIMALNEIFSCLGLILGPVVGSFIFVYGGFFVSCFSVGVVVLAYVPVLVLAVGRGNKYKIESRESISVGRLVIRPRICIHFFLGMLITLALGVNMPTFQFHLISYGIQEDLIGYWYMITTLAYLMSSVVLGKLNSEKYERLLYSGICLYAIAYMLLGPCPHIFAKSLVLVGIGHHLVGWACSMLYSIFYVVPLVPYLIKIAKEDFNIQADDRLNDAINVIVNVSICTGEVIGPLLGSFIPSYFEQEIKFKITYCLVSLLFVVFGIFYMIFNKSSNTSRQIELEVSFLDKRNDSTSLIQSESI